MSTNLQKLALNEEKKIYKSVQGVHLRQYQDL